MDKNGLFVCPNHTGDLTLSPAGCGRLYMRAQAARKAHSSEELASVWPCLGCAIGKAHKALIKVGKQARLHGANLENESAETRRERGKRGAAAGIISRNYVSHAANERMR